MSLGRNLAAGLANSFWAALVTLISVPFFLRYLGIEAFGLIGFFTALQAVLLVFDLGLSPAMSREVARTSSAERDQARDLLHTLAWVFWAAAALIAVSIYVAAPVIGGGWFTSSGLPPSTIAQAVSIMGVVVAWRLPSGLYQGALLGAQRMVSISAIEIATATASNLGAVAVLALVSPTIQAFFIWQAAVGLFNVLAMRAAAWDALKDPGGDQAKADIGALQRIWRFSAGTAVTAALGAIFLQSDKVILSKIVSLEQLGRYSLAGIAARVLYLFVAPTFSVVYPRLTALQSAGDSAQVALLYKSGTRLLCAIVFPIAIYIGVFSRDIFTIWTGDANLARSIEPVVSLLLLGTAINAVMHFPYALQLAYGRSHLAAVTNLILLLVFAPLVVVLALTFGITGAAAAWAVLNALYLALGVWITHRSLLRGEGRGWLVGDVGLPMLLAVLLVGGVGALIRSLDLFSPLVRLALGGGLVASAVAGVVALSPQLVEVARRIALGFGPAMERPAGLA